MRRLSLKGLNRYRNIGLLFARGIPGVIFLYHGYQKFDGGFDGVGRFLDSLGVPLPDLLAYVLTFGELIGGALLIIGFLTRLMALGLMLDMILAILLVKIDVGLIAPMGGGPGAELELALIASMFAVATFGPGSLSVDRNAGIEGRV
jgi:putative oxidoreductase